MVIATVRWQMNRRSWRSRGPTPLEELDIAALDHVRLPNDALSQAALHVAQTLYLPWLCQHVLRTYAWGALLGLNSGVRYEPPLLFAACALHDLGLTPHAAEPPEHCFAVRGGQAARQLYLSFGGSAADARRVAHAIMLHLDLHVSPGQGAEAHLLHEGASLDVVGRRGREVPPALQRAVLAAHPRLDMKLELCRCMQKEAVHAPHSRASVLVRRLSFCELIEKAPFDE
jgi:hypothetical protein